MKNAIEKAKKIAREYFEIPERIQRLANLATSDLYWGPIGLDDEWERENYKDFRSATSEVKQFLNTLPRQIWIDLDCEDVSTVEPEGYQDEDGEWIEPYLEQTFYFEGKEIAKLLFDRELIAHL